MISRSLGDTIQSNSVEAGFMWEVTFELKGKETLEKLRVGEGYPILCFPCSVLGRPAWAGTNMKSGL